MASILTGVLAVLFVINAANGLTCYECKSQDSTRCKWSSVSFTFPTEECTSVLFWPKCYKITAENMDGEEYIARGCFSGPTSRCKIIAKKIGWQSPERLQNMNCYICETNKCNSASKLAGFALLGIILPSVGLIL